MLKAGLALFSKQLQTGQTTPVLKVPMSVMYFSLVLTFALILVIQAVVLVEKVMDLKNKEGRRHDAGVILFVAFAACLVIGVPVSISLGVASLCSVVFGGLSASSTVIAQRIFGGLQSTSIYGHRILRTCRKPDDKRWYLPPYRKLC